MVYYMKSKVITIRIPRDLEEKMRKINVNWSEEIRRFIEEKIRYYEFSEAIMRMRSRAKNRKVDIDSTSLIREDRDMR